MRKTTPIEGRFLSRVDRRSDGECWPWLGFINRQGYGTFAGENPGGSGYAHRFAYKFWVAPLPPGIEVDHLCHNRSCVNPKHLRGVTHGQNSQNLSGATARSKSGVRGVYFVKARNKWLAQVTLNRRIVYSRRFATREQAEAAVIEARNKFHTHNSLDRQR